MDIFTEDGDLDFAAARKEAASLAGARTSDVAKLRAQELTIHTLLDIAASLRVLAVESAEAMRDTAEDWPYLHVADAVFGARAVTLAEHEDSGGYPLRWLEVGDVVHRADDPTAVAEVAKVGVTEDEPYADLSVDPNGDALVRLFQRDLVLLRGDEAPHVSTPEEDAAMIDADDAPELFEDVAEAESLEVIAAAEVYADEIDDDFDDHDADAEDAVAKLAEAEAARKAAKKKGSKK